jgi:hypothetical protein
MKISKIDIIFVIVYMVILVLLLLTTPVTISLIGPDTTDKYDIIWSNVLYLLLYAVVVPLLYIGIRWYYQKKKIK